MFLHIGREGDETSLAKHKQKKIALGNRWLAIFNETNTLYIQPMTILLIWTKK